MTQPSAEVTPGKRGTSAARSPTSRISAPACSAPPPPKGIAAKRSPDHGRARSRPAGSRRPWGIGDASGWPRPPSSHPGPSGSPTCWSIASRAASTSSRSASLPPMGRSAIDAAEHHIGIGQRRAVIALAVAGRAGARAGDSGPTCKQAAGIDATRSSRRRRRWWISIIGVRITMPKSIVVCAAMCRLPPTTSETSKEVPPRSPVMMSGKPAASCDGSSRDHARSGARQRRAHRQAARGRRST
jgi:hypothetical protein